MATTGLEPPDLDLEIEHVEAADPLLGHRIVPDVPVVTADLLVAPGTEGVRSLAGEDDHPDGRVVPGGVEGVGQLEEGLGAEGVADLRAGDGQLGDAVRHLVADVPVGAPRLPGGQGLPAEPLHRVDRRPYDHRLWRPGPLRTVVHASLSNHSTIHS